MYEEHEGLRVAVDRALGGGPPEITFLISLVGRTSSRILTWFLDEGQLTANGVLFLVGDPNDAGKKLKDYGLEPIYKEVVEHLWGRWLIVPVDNGVLSFRWFGKGWRLLRRLEPDRNGAHVNDALRDGPILMTVAHTLTTSTSLSHTQIAGVYAMAKPLHVERLSPYSDMDLADDIAGELEKDLQVTNTVVEGPAKRRTIAFWVAWNPSHRDTVLARLKEKLKSLFGLSEEKLVMIGGSLSPEKSRSFKLRRKYKTDRKYLALMLLFELTPEEIERLGPQFSFIRDVWRERREEQELRSEDFNETNEAGPYN
jgi:hypothetical protein